MRIRHRGSLEDRTAVALFKRWSTGWLGCASTSRCVAFCSDSQSITNTSPSLKGNLTKRFAATAVAWNAQGARWTPFTNGCTRASLNKSVSSTNRRRSLLNTGATKPRQARQTQAQSLRQLSLTSVAASCRELRRGSAEYANECQPRTCVLKQSVRRASSCGVAGRCVRKQSASEDGGAAVDRRGADALPSPAAMLHRRTTGAGNNLASRSSIGVPAYGFATFWRPASRRRRRRRRRRSHALIPRSRGADRRTAAGEF